MALSISVVESEPFAGQKPGTSGLRKAVKVSTLIRIIQQIRIKNWIQILLHKTVIGRYVGRYWDIRYGTYLVSPVRFFYLKFPSTYGRYGTRYLL